MMFLYSNSSSKAEVGARNRGIDMIGFTMFFFFFLEQCGFGDVAFGKWCDSLSSS